MTEALHYKSEMRSPSTSDSQFILYEKSHLIRMQGLACWSSHAEAIDRLTGSTDPDR